MSLNAHSIASMLFDLPSFLLWLFKMATSFKCLWRNSQAGLLWGKWESKSETKRTWLSRWYTFIYDELTLSIAPSWLYMQKSHVTPRPRGHLHMTKIPTFTFVCTRVHCTLNFFDAYCQPPVIDHKFYEKGWAPNIPEWKVFFLKILHFHFLPTQIGLYINILLPTDLILT